MGDLSVANYLGMLQDDPLDSSLIEGLRKALSNGESADSTEALRLIELARGEHERRGEYLAAAWLMEVESHLVADDPDFQAVLLKELARVHCDELMNDAGAREVYERLGGLQSPDPDVAQAVEHLEQARASWKKIAQRFVEEARDSADARLKTGLLTRAASLLWQYGDDDDKLRSDDLFDEALAEDPSYGRTARLYVTSLRARERWEDVVSVLVRAAHAARTQEGKASLWLHAARVLQRQIHSKERAAEAYEHVVTHTPADAEALRFLVEYYSEKKAWDDLVGLYENALRSRLKLEDEEGVLLQLAMVHWRIRGDAEAAEPFFGRLRKIDPAHPGMLDYYREHLSDEPPERLLTILGDAQRATHDDAQRLELAQEVALKAQRTGHTDRAIEAWKAAERIDPNNAEARKALRVLYRSEGKWNALVELIRHEVDSLGPNARDERLRFLRELLVIYRDDLKLDSMVSQTEAAIVAEDPTDFGALDSLSESYASAGKWSDLTQLLTKQADAIVDPTERAMIQMRVAKLWLNELDNPSQAARPLESIIELDPDHREALGLLKGVYEKKRKWGSLLDVLKKEAELSSDPTARLVAKVQMAELCTDKLHRNAEAIALWKEVLEEAPETPGALTALESLAERDKDWSTLAMLLERQARSAEPDEQVALLHRLAAMYSDRLEEPDRAQATWTQILDIDPDNTRARRLLRDAYFKEGKWAALEPLYAPTGRWSELAEVLIEGAESVKDPALSRELSRQAARIYRDEMGEPHRAVPCYERMLSLDADCVEAAEALAPIYEQESKWDRLVRVLETLERNVSSDSDPNERLARVDKLRRLYAEKLRDPAAAFQWATLAYELAPSDATVVGQLEQTAEAAGTHGALVSLYSHRAKQRATPDRERTRLRKRIASLAGERLGQSEEAIGQLREILRDHPGDAETVAVLDRLYRADDRFVELRELYELRLEHAQDSAEHWVLLTELARLEEQQLNDLPSASERYWAVLEVRPTDRDALSALERISEHLEQWERLSEVLERRQETGLTDRERLDINVRLGDLRRLHLGDNAGALHAYRRALELDGDREEAILGLEVIAQADRKLFSEAAEVLDSAYTRRGEFAKLSELLEQKLKATDSKRDKRSLKLRLAELAASELGDVEGSYRALESAFLDRPSDRDLLDRLWGVTEAAEKHEALASALTTALEAGDLDKDSTTELCRRVARLYDGVLDRSEEAESFHKQVLAAEPQDEIAFAALKELFTKHERWDELRDLVQDRIAGIVDGEARVELLMQLCFLFEDILDDPVRAIGAYEQLLELEPTHLPSRRALERLYSRTEQWAELAELLRRDLDDVDGDEFVEISYELGSLCETKLEELELAVDHYQQVVETDPAHVQAREGLKRLMANPEQRQRVATILEPVLDAHALHQDLAEVLEVQLEDIQDPVSVAGILTRLGEIYEAKLDDKLQAFDAYARAVAVDPVDEENRRQLGRLAEDTNAYRAQAKVLEGVLEKLSDTFLRTDILVELARLWDERLGEAERAEQTYARLLEAQPENLELSLRSLEALERLHAQLGNHKALCQDLRRHIELEDDPERRAEMLFRLAELLEREVGDIDGAIEVQRRRLEIDPTNDEILQSLQGLYQRTAQWEPLIDILQMRELNIPEDDPQQLELQRQIAHIYEENLDDTESAIAAYQDVVSRYGHDPESLRGLARLYRSVERWHELQDTIEMQAEEATEPEERIGFLFESAELMRFHTNDVQRAFETYSEILEQAPEHQPSMEVLHELVDDEDSTLRVPAAKRLAALHAARLQYKDQVQMLSVVASSEDVFERLQVLREAAEVSANQLNDASAAFEFQGLAVLHGLDEPGAGLIFDDFHRFAEQSGRWRDYAAALGEVSPKILDPELRAHVMMRAADVAANRLNDSELAKKHYVRLLEDQPDHVEALDALLAAATQSRDHETVARLVERKAELSGDRQERSELFVRQALLYEREIGDHDRAINAFDQAVVERDNEHAYEGLERLYKRTERWGDLAELYERKIERRIGDPADIHYRLGQLCVTELQDGWRALDHFREALNLNNDHAPTISALEALTQEPEHRAAAAELLEPVFLRRMDWPRVIEIIEARLSEEADPFERIELLRRLAEVQETHIEDLDAALSTYGKIVLEDPTDASLRSPFSRLGRSLERWEDLASTYDSALSQIELDDTESAKLAIETAELYDQRLKQVDKAAVYYARAFRFDPSDSLLAERLSSVYTRGSAWDDLLALYEERERFADTDQERVATLHKIAQTQSQHLDDHDAAIETYRRVLELSPQDERAIVAIDGLLDRQERWHDLAEHLQLRMQRAEGTGVAVDFQCRLAELTDEHLGDRERAIALLEDVLTQDSEHEPTLRALEHIGQDETYALRVADILEPIYRSSGDWERQVAILELRLTQSGEDAERVELLSAIARLYEDQGADLDAAFHAWKRALFIDPSNAVPRRELDRLSQELENWDEYAEAYTHAARISKTAELRESLLLRVAQVHDQRRGDPRAAIREYERVLDEDPASESALSNSQVLYTMMGDWQGLARLLEHRVEHSKVPAARVAFLNQLGTLWEEELGDTNRALEVFDRAREQDPADREALAALDRILSGSDQPQRLAEVLAKRFSLEDDPLQGVELGIRLADLHETQLGDSDRAIAVLKDVANIGPGQARALEQLARLHERQGQWADLVEVLGRRFDISEHEAQRVALTHRIAEVYEQELDDVDRAIDTYESAVRMDPHHEPSLQALMRISKLADYRERAVDIVEPCLRRQERWDELAALIEEGVHAYDDPQARSERLMSLAEIHEQERGDADSAFDVYLRVLAERPGRPDALERAQHLAESLGRWQPLADSLTTQAAAALEPTLAARLHALHAEIADAELRLPGVAIDSYQQAVALVGDQPAFLEALDRLYEQTEHWAALGDVLDRRIQAGPPDRAALLLRLGRLRVDHLDDVEGGLSAFQDVLEIDPENDFAVEALRELSKGTGVASIALDALERQYRQTGDFERLAALYDQRVAQADTDGNRVRLLREAAELWENQLRRPAEALARVRGALILVPHEEALVDDLERLCEEAGQWELVRGLSDEAAANPDVERRDLYNLRLRVAQWTREHLRDVQAAEQELEAALGLDPEPIEAHEQRIALFEEQGRSADAVAGLRELSAVETTPARRIERLRRAADIADSTLEDPAVSAECYEAILALERHDHRALEALSKIRREQGRWHDVVDLLQRRLEHERRTETRVDLMRELGQVLAGPLGDVPRAIETYEAVLEEAPEDGGAFRALEQLYERSGLFEQLRTLLERGLKDAATEADRRTYGMRLAELSESTLEDRAAAIEYLRRVLEVGPGDSAAKQALSRLLQSEGRWDELAVLLEREVEEAPDSAIRLPLLYRLAELHEEHREDLGAATRAYQRIVVDEGDREATLDKLASLFERREDWSGAVDALDRLARVADAPRAVEAAHHMADLASEKLGDAARVRSGLQTAYRLAPGSPETRDRLKAHYEQEGDYPELAKILEAELEVAEDKPAKLGLLRDLAAIHRNHLRDPAGSAKYLERAVSLGEDDRDMLIPLSDLYMDSGRHKDAVPILERVIESYGKQRSKELATYHHRLGRALEALGKTDDALASYDKAFTIDLTNIHVLWDLGKLTYARGDLARAQKSFRALLLQRLDASAGIAKADIYFHLGDIAVKQGDSHKAISMLERALAEDKAHRAATELLAELKS